MTHKQLIDIIHQTGQLWSVIDKDLTHLDHYMQGLQKRWM